MNIDPVSANWYETFFTTPVNEFWEAIVPPQAAQADVAFAVRHLRPQPTAEILDLACGAGRHSFALARLGYRVTGIDISSDAIARARDLARKQALDIAFERADMLLDLDFHDRFDGVVCFGNSFGYCTPERTRCLLMRISSALRPGGRLILDTGVCAESILPLRDRQQFEFPRGSYRTEASYDPLLSALRTNALLTLDGHVYPLSYLHYILTSGELVRMTVEAKFSDVTLHSDTNDSPFAPGSPRLLLTAARR